MKKYLVNFATKKFKKSQKKLNKTALKFGIDKVFSFSMEDIIKTDFYKNNKNILDQKRGAGYWLWKPYIILQTFEKIKDGDILVYADSGIEIINNLNPIFEIIQNGNSVVTFSCGGHLNKHWTKRDCFVLMDCDSEKYWNSEQRLGSFHFYKKDDASRIFIENWLKFCKNENILTDIKNIEGQNSFEGFIDHRHDQSVFSILAVKNNIEMFRDPTQWGNYLKLPGFRRSKEFLHREYSTNPYTNSRYDTLLNHHRNNRKKSNPLSLFRKIINIIK